jgi:hypothetical protein
VGRGGAGAVFEAFADVEGEEAGEVVGAGAGGEAVVELGPAGGFDGGVVEAAFDFGVGVLGAGAEALAELVEGRGVEEKGDEAVGEVFVSGAGGADGGGALDVDVEEDVVVEVEEGEDVALAGAVEAVVDAGVLEEFAGGEGGFELGGGEEVVVNAVAFAGAGGAAGAGDNAAGAGGGGEELVAEGGFAGAGGAGDDEEEAGAVGKGRQRLGHGETISDK